MADEALLRQVNNDIWHAFTSAYAARDAAAFLAVHAKDLIRAGGPTKQAHTFDEYAADISRWFTDLTENGDNIGIELRFTERIASESIASERGVYRIVQTRSDGGERLFYGRFHTFARKVEGRWRIAADYDSDEGGTVDDAAFAAGTQLDDVAAFAG